MCFGCSKRTSESTAEARGILAAISPGIGSRSIDCNRSCGFPRGPPVCNSQYCSQCNIPYCIGIMQFPLTSCPCCCQMVALNAGKDVANKSHLRIMGESRKGAWSQLLSVLHCCPVVLRVYESREHKARICRGPTAPTMCQVAAALKVCMRSLWWPVTARHSRRRRHNCPDEPPPQESFCTRVAKVLELSWDAHHPFVWLSWNLGARPEGIS